MSPFGAEPILDSYFAVVLIVVGLFALLAIGPQFGGLSPHRKMTLIGLRIGVILLAALLMVRPTLVHETKTARRPVLVMLFDISRSMQLLSGTGELTRWQVQKNALDKVRPALAGLAEDMDVRVYAYDGRLHPVEMANGAFPIPDSPQGEQTDIGTPLAEALRAEQGKRVAAVILLGDGVQTAFDPQIESQEAARKLRDDFGSPLFAAAIGPPADAAQSRDVAVERLDQQFTVFVKNELTVKSLIRVRGYAKKDIPVELTLEDAQGKTRSIAVKQVRSDDDGKQVEVAFSFTPQETGNFRLRVTAKKQDNELVVKNNRMDAYLTVLEGGLRVLYLDGEKRFEQKFVRRSLDASPDIELDDRIIDKRGRARWPVDLGDDFTGGKYDAYIIGDLPSSALGPANLEALAQAVAKGKGLMMIGGLRSFGRGRYHQTALGDVLPIVTDRLEGVEFGTEEPDEFYLDGPVPMVPTESHPITRLAGEADNLRVWQQLPPLLWAYKFADVKNAPGVRTLLASPAGKPLLVSGEFGRGRVLAFAGQSTYLWPMRGKELEHKRFWRQVVLWLVRREDVDKSEVWVRLDQRRFQPGGRVQVTAGTRTAVGDPIPEATLETTVVYPDNRREPLRLSAEKENYSGSLALSQPGDYAVETTARVGDKVIGTSRAEFLVFDRDIELSNPAADPDHFAALAGWTKEFGGRAVAPEELPAIVEEIHRQPTAYEVRQTRWRLAGTAGEAWLFLLLVVGGLSGEWYLRKKWGLV